jgi:5-methylcytosine-specific restriction endonuclease McrA
VEYLAAGFSNVTNSYKFYWFLAILDQIKAGQAQIIPFRHLIATMIGDVWYPANYFRLSFGKQDRLGDLVLAVQRDQNLPANTSRSEVIHAALHYWQLPDSALARDVQSLGVYVPYRFLRPFFHKELRGMVDWKVNAAISALAQDRFHHSVEPCLYRFVEEPELAVELHPRWVDYLLTNFPIVVGYCFWHLTNYLQKNNPHVPNIVAKLSEPGQRKLNTARRFWQEAMEELSDFRCIYTGERIEQQSFSLDHFLPWSFVAHDLLWNIIPTSRQINSTKSDQLPALERYFEPFIQMQYNALQAVAAQRKPKLVEDYTVLLKESSLDGLLNLPFATFRQALNDTILPQVQIARNMGFATDWSYQRQ